MTETTTTLNRQHAIDAAANKLVDTELPLDDRFDNENGSILNILFSKVQSVARIKSKAGAVRANHWHKTDDHYAYVESGAVIYVEHELKEDGSIKSPGAAQTFKAGQAFYTPPGRAHAMIFPVETVIYTFARNTRDHEGHEADVVRVKVISDSFAKELIQQYHLDNPSHAVSSR